MAPRLHHDFGAMLVFGNPSKEAVDLMVTE
jgi:hypothetical protein